MIIVGFAIGASGQPNCNTALSRLAKAAAQKAITAHENTACSGLKNGAVRIDKTKRLEMLDVRVCEDGSVVSANISVRVRCATSDAAFVKVEIEEIASALASADRNLCSAERQCIRGGICAQGGPKDR